ncbi:hypothetical protein EYZ11_011676 [Aspergillus tanneri]|nr:hypothetical protein EYZ11_011676 [Aspergillus tanneri]
MVGSGINLSMQNFDRILSVDKGNRTATVQAGVTLSKLGSHLRQMGLQPPLVLEWGNYHIGAISGTHANDTETGRAAQFSSYVLGVKLVTPTGELMEISGNHNAEYLPAIRSHFGMFGVIYEVTLEVRENRPLSITFMKVNLDDFLDNFHEEIQSLKINYDHVFGMLCPQSGKLYWQGRKFIEQEKTSRHFLSTWKNRVGAKNALFKIALSLIRATSPVSCSATRAKVLSIAFVGLPMAIVKHIPYVINPCDRGKLYEEKDARLDFYDWVFPEKNWVGMARSFLQLSYKFRKDHNFGLPLPALIYFIPKDQASLLSRSRDANMMAIDPLYPYPEDTTWKEFRLEFNKIAMLHGGIPHINKTRDGAVYCFGKAIDPAVMHLFLKQRAHFDPKNLFLNDHFREMFAEYL